MSDTRATFERLLEKSNELKNGPERVVLLEEAVGLADQLGDADAGFRARLELMEAATFGGRPDLLLTAFDWCLAQYDREPDRFELKDLLWKYKWVVGNVVEFPHISRERIEAMLADMESRFQKAGSTLHAVHQARREVLTDMGDLAAAEQAANELAKTKRDWLSDCRACVVDVTAGHLANERRDAEAIEEAAPILSRRVKCAHVPHRTYGKLLLPLLRLGRLDEAAAYHQEGYRLIGDNPEFLSPAGRHLEFAALTGNFDQAVEILEVYLPHALATPSIHSRMNFFGAVRLFLDVLSENGQPTLAARLPSEFPLFAANAIYDVAELLEWFGAEVGSLAAQFDARNGNDYYARRFAETRDLKNLASSIPIEADSD